MGSSYAARWLMVAAKVVRHAAMPCNDAHRHSGTLVPLIPVAMANTFLPDGSGSVDRPGLIAGLGIATFINTGLFTLIYGLGVLGILAVQQMPFDEFNALFDDARAMLGDEDPDRFDTMVAILHAHGSALMGVFFLRTVLRLVGAIGMWRGRRNGFYVYAAAQLLGIFAPHLFLPWSMLGDFGPLMAVGMTAAYGSQLKRFAA